MDKHSTLLDALGGEAGCLRLSKAFYARVQDDPILHPLFPGKTLRCATEEFAAFLVQFLEGDEAQTQKRWWLSLHESHARFQISPAQRSAWLKHMRETLDALPMHDETKTALRQFFVHSSGYLVDKPAIAPEHSELTTRWDEQRTLDHLVGAIAAGRDEEAVAIAARFASRPSVFVGLLTRMMQTGRESLITFVVNALEHDPSLLTHRFAGKTLLHYAAGSGSLVVVQLLLRLGMDPNIQDSGKHTPLYSAANECAAESGPQIVEVLVHAGADVNWHGGVTRATPLHMAARRGFLGIAQALLECGAALDAKDSKGETPLQRATNTRKHALAQFLAKREADAVTR